MCFTIAKSPPGDGPSEYIVTDYYLSKDNVDKVVDEIATKMVVTTDRNIPKAHFKHIKPYWSSYLKELHQYKMKMGRKWVNNGRPTDIHSQVYSEYKAAKRVFRREKRRAEHMYEKNNNW